jgi:hypothetical protein
MDDAPDVIVANGICGGRHGHLPPCPGAAIANFSFQHAWRGLVAPVSCGNILEGRTQRFLSNGVAGQAIGLPGQVFSVSGERIACKQSGGQNEETTMVHGTPFDLKQFPPL